MAAIAQTDLTEMAGLTSGEYCRLNSFSKRVDKFRSVLFTFFNASFRFVAFLAAFLDSFDKAFAFAFAFFDNIGEKKLLLLLELELELERLLLLLERLFVLVLLLLE